jgi:hypothetical protein
MKTDHSMTVAMLLSCDSFESFFGAVLQLDRDKYLRNYRNDWAWYYAAGLIENGIRPIIYIPSIMEEFTKQRWGSASAFFLSRLGTGPLLHCVARCVQPDGPSTFRSVSMPPLF